MTRVGNSYSWVQLGSVKSGWVSGSGSCSVCTATSRNDPLPVCASPNSASRAQARPELYLSERSVLGVYLEDGALERHDDEALVGLLSMTLMAAVFNTQVSPLALLYLLYHTYHASTVLVNTQDAHHPQRSPPLTGLSPSLTLTLALTSHPQPHPHPLCFPFAVISSS